MLRLLSSNSTNIHQHLFTEVLLKQSDVSDFFGALTTSRGLGLGDIGCNGDLIAWSSTRGRRMR